MAVLLSEVGEIMRAGVPILSFVGYSRRVQKRQPIFIAIVTSIALCSLAACGEASESPTPSATPATSASTTPSPTATPTPASTNLDGIEVTGEYLKEATTKVTTPFVIDQTRTKVLKEGKGDTIAANAIVELHYSGVNGRSGDVFDSSFERGATARFSLAQVITGFAKGLTGQKVGSRVLIGMPGTDAYDSVGGSGNGMIQVGDTLLFVVDIVETWTGPKGEAVKPVAGLPVVTDNGTAAPTIQIPKTDPPTKMVSQVLIEGTGKKVAAESTIVTHYVGYSWKTGEVIDSVYERLDEGQLSSAIPGWISGLTGKAERSRVLLVLPPADGYPQGSNNPQVEAGDTIVYVVDLLMVQ